MLLLFTAGLFAGGVQSIAVTITTLLSLQFRVLEPISVSIGSHTTALSIKSTTLLTLFYLLTALGLALSRNRFVDATASRLRQASRRMCPANPNYAGKALLVQLTIAAVGFGLLALCLPPLTLVEIADAIGCAAVMPVIWPAMMSIVAAAFGANAHAAAEAL